MFTQGVMVHCRYSSSPYGLWRDPYLTLCMKFHDQIQVQATDRTQSTGDDTWIGCLFNKHCPKHSHLHHHRSISTNKFVGKNGIKLVLKPGWKGRSSWPAAPQWQISLVYCRLRISCILFAHNYFHLFRSVLITSLPLLCTIYSATNIRIWDAIKMFSCVYNQ